MKTDTATPNSPAGAGSSPSSWSGLWSIHITGPDEYHAKASKEAAETAATEFNAWFNRQTKTVNTPNMRATVQPWPFDAQSHADVMSDLQKPLKRRKAAAESEPKTVLPLPRSDSVATDMLLAMDAMWGALDAARDMLSQNFDQDDGRFVKMGDALGQAQDLLTPYFEHGKVVLPSQTGKDQA